MASMASALTASTIATNRNYKVPSTSKISIDKLLRVGFYNLERTIGKGNFAVVKLASNIVTKSKVAIKIIDKTCLNEEYLAKTYREISILKSLKHPHITRLYEVMQSETMIYLVTEYAANGEIFDHLVENGRMKEPEAARVFTQLVSAVEYCHGKGVVHRDLKAENVLLDKNMNIKLADFGFSNRYEDGNALSTWCGSPPYAAPEVFQGLNYDGPKADIWSLGVVLYALVCGALPFDGKTLLDLKSRVVAGKFRIPYFMSQNCEHLIRNMLVVEPERRYTLNQIIKHRWLSEWALKVEHGYLESNPSHTPSTTVNNGSNNRLSESITSVPNLDSVVMSHMLQLSGLTADNIAQSVHENRFDNIYAIYHLLYDKLQQKRREYQKLQQHANGMRSRTSITTGIVDRSEFQNTSDCTDRLSPLNNTNTLQNEAGLRWSDMAVSLEKFSDMELECLQLQNELLHPSTEAVLNSQTASVNSSANNNTNNTGNTRRHTVGPGDVAHEQALADPNAVPLNFKCEPQDRTQTIGQYPPINLPMLQNQPLHYLTIKDQHLLKPPLVMNATGSFNRRASDGGANLPYCFTTIQQNPNSIHGQHVQQQSHAYYISPSTVSTNANNLDAMANVTETLTSQNCASEESTEEIQRYMQTRGCSKRHTVGCTEDLTLTTRQTSGDRTPLAHMETTVSGLTQTSPNAIVMTPTTGAGIRTRRTGLLTVTERPPVISPELIREVETRMNRNYMPPALKMQFNAYSASFGQSPPSSGVTSINSSPYPTSLTDASAHYPKSLPLNVNTLSSSSNASVTIATVMSTSMSTSVPTSALSTAGVTTYNCRRIYGKACKLPPVQEVGRYSPVRRASDGSKAQFQGPLQECQYLQKGIAQRNYLAAPSPPLLETSISLPGSPINSKLILSGNSSMKRSGITGIIPNPNSVWQCNTITGKCLELPSDILQNLIPILDKLVKEQRLTIENAQNIMTTGTMSWDIAAYLGIMSDIQGQSTSSNSLSGVNRKVLPQHQPFSFNLTPLLSPNTINNCMSNKDETNKDMLQETGNFTVAQSPQQILELHTKQLLSDTHEIQGQKCPTSFLQNSAACNNNCQSPLYGNCSSSNISTTQGANVTGSGSCSGGGSSPLHQITKGISYLTTGGRGSITRGTSGFSENALVCNNQQPLDLSMDISASEDDGESHPINNARNLFAPADITTCGYYMDKPLNLSPCPTVRVVTTPPASPNLCIIQEEHASSHLYHSISSDINNTIPNSYQNDEIGTMYQLTHPQICLTDVQGSEITLVAVSPEHSNSRDSYCERSNQCPLNNTDNSTPLISLQRLIINEPTDDMPSITRGIGRKTSLENEWSQHQQSQHNSTPSCNVSYVNRRGSDKSLGFSDDSLSNDSNNLSPCQEPSASSGFKSDSHSEIGDHTEGHLTPDSMCESRRLSNEMFYEVPLPYECSKLDTGRILEMVKQTINSTMPPKGFVIHKGVETQKESEQNTTIITPSEKNVSACNSTRIANNAPSSNCNVTSSAVSSTYTLDTSIETSTPPLTNLSLEYSGGLQIEVQVCEGRSRDNQTTGKGIKLRRISGDEFEYGKLCQQLISNLNMQQVVG